MLAYHFKPQKSRIIPEVFISQDFDYIDWTTRTPAGDIRVVGYKGVVRYNIKERKYHYYFSHSPKNKLGEALNIIWHVCRCPKYCLAWFFKWRYSA
jgi:hypothetical protein